MIYIKFTLSKGDPIVLPKDKAEEVLDSPTQVVKIMGQDGKWNGKIINKAFIVSTDIDRENSHDEPEQGNLLQLSPDSRSTEEIREIQKEAFGKLKKKLGW